MAHDEDNLVEVPETMFAKAISGMVNRHIRAQLPDIQMTLGGFVDALRAIVEAGSGDKEVWYDFPGATPTVFMSWRGVYAFLALGWTNEWREKEQTARELLQHAEEAIGGVFEGYKGGMFVMDRDTPLWVANDGYTGCTVITGVSDELSSVIIHTAYIDAL